MGKVYMGLFRFLGVLSIIILFGINDVCGQVSKPPKPVSIPGNICRGEMEAQFEVPIHNDTKNVIRWDWQRVVWKEECEIRDDCLECTAPEYEYDSAARARCERDCMRRFCKDVLDILGEYEDAGKVLKYKVSANSTELGRYKKWYSDTDHSEWSETESRNYQDYYYQVHEPSSIESTSGDNAITNNLCGENYIQLKVNLESGKNWNDHTFKWYRVVDSKPTLLIGNESTITDLPPSKNVNIYYEVEVFHISCNEPAYRKKSNTFFFHEPVPPSFTVNTNNTGRIKQQKTSCEAAKNGKIIISGKSDEAGKHYFYNIALKNPAKPGGIEKTTILSSPKISGDQTFTFPDDVPYPEGETSLEEEEWRRYTNITKGDYIVQVINGEAGYTLDSAFNNEGYCAKEFEIAVLTEPELIIGNFKVAQKISCYAGADGAIRVEFSGGSIPYHLQLFKGTEKDFITNGTKSILQAETTIHNVNRTGYTFENLSAGHYKVHITLADAVCLKETENSIYLDQPPTLSLASDDVARSIDDLAYNGSWITCPGANDAYLEIKPKGGNLANKYSATLYINDPATAQDKLYAVSKTFIGTYKFENLPPGAYKVTVTDSCSNGPVTSAIYSIVEPPSLVINSLSSEPITCYDISNGTFTVSASGGTGTRQFKIDGGTWQEKKDKNEAYVFTELDSGWHVVEARDVNNCVAAQPFSFKLDYPTPLSFTVDSLMMPLCHNGSDGKLFIRPFGGEPYTQSYEISLTSSEVSRNFTKPDVDGLVVFDQLPSGDYIITVRDQQTNRYTCQTDSTVFLGQPSRIRLEVNPVSLPSCAGAADGSVKVQASEGTPGTDPAYYYSMDGIHFVKPNDSTGAVFTGLKAGRYTFYAVDSHHKDYGPPVAFDGDSRSQLCAVSSDFTLEEPDYMAIYTTMQPVTCYGSATGNIVVDSITGGSGSYTYQWEKFQGTYQQLTPANPLMLAHLTQGTYRLTVQDAAGCEAMAIIEVTQPDIALAINTVQPHLESCAATTDDKLQVFAQGGYPPYTYQLNDGASRTYGFFDGLTAGTYTLTVQDQLGCKVQQTATLTTDQLTVKVVQQLPATTGFHDGLLQLNVSGGQHKKYYLDGILSHTGSEFSGLTAGAHTITIEYNNQCRWQQTYTVDEVAQPVPALRVTTQNLQHVSCGDALDGRVEIAITGGMSPYILQWDDPQQQTATEAVGLAKGTYHLTVTDAEATTVVYPVTIEGPAPFEVVNAIAVSPVCYQGADGYAEVVAVGGTAPYSYAWNDPQQQTTARASQLLAGTYTVTLTDQQGCQLSQQLTIHATPAPGDVLEPEGVTLCTGQAIALDAGDQWRTYQWTGDNGFRSGAQQVIINQAGRYFLQVTSEQGCVVYDTLDLITTDNVIEGEFLVPTQIIVGDTVVLTEVSWPVPEQAAWTYDKNIISQKSDSEKEFIVFPQAGEYTVTLSVLVGNCRDEVTKKIIVSDATATVPVENARLGYVAKNEYLLYPNPNSGRFTLKVDMQEAQHIRVSVYDALFKYSYLQQTSSDIKSIEKEINLTHLNHGVYALIIETASEVKILRFVIR